MALLVGVLIGLVLGLTGAGGSVLAVPLLILLLDLSAQQAMAISLGAVAVVALFGALGKLKSGDIQWLPAAVYASLGAIVAPLGNWLNRQVDATVLLAGFSVLVIFVAARLWSQARHNPEETRVVRASRVADEQQNGAVCRFNNYETFHIGLPCVLGMTGGALLTGLLSGLFGVGGGFLIVPTLLFLTGISIKQAVATSLVVIAVVSSSGFAGYLLSGNPLDTALLSQIALGGVAGMAVGIFVSHYVAGPQLQRLFAVIMLLMALMTLLQQLIL